MVALGADGMGSNLGVSFWQMFGHLYDVAGMTVGVVKGKGKLSTTKQQLMLLVNDVRGRY